MIRRPPRSTRTDTLFPYTTLFRSLWLTFLQVLGRPELQDDPRYSTNAARVTNRIALIEDLAPTFLTRTREEWIDALLAAGVPAAPILDYGEAVGSEQAVARDMVMQVPHPVEGERSDEHTSELKSLMRISYAVFCLKKKNI